MADPTFTDLEPSQRRLVERNSSTLAVVVCSPRTKPYDLEAAVRSLLRQVHVIGVTIVVDMTERDASWAMAQALKVARPSKVHVCELWQPSPKAWKIAEGVMSAGKWQHHADLIALVAPEAELDPIAIDEAMVRLYSEDECGAVTGTRAGRLRHIRWPVGAEKFTLWRAPVLESLCRHIADQELGFEGPTGRLVSRAKNQGWLISRSRRALVHV